MALGLVAFSLTVMLGVLPIGLRSVQDSVNQQGISNIARQLRAELQQIPFTGGSANSAYSLKSLNTKSYFYTREGVRTAEGDANGYFSARIDVGDAHVPGGSATYDTNAQNVTVTLSYPLCAPEINRQKEVLSLIFARQGGY